MENVNTLDLENPVSRIYPTEIFIDFTKIQKDIHYSLASYRAKLEKSKCPSISV